MKGVLQRHQQQEDYFGDETRWQSWLDVEAGLALVQSELGIIPVDAGPQIAKVAHLACLDIARLRCEIDKTMAPVFALSEELARVAGAASDYVHWGATTQNIVETGRLLVLQRVHDNIKRDLHQLLMVLADQAECHAGLVMIGRTNRQNALPITYGFKIAGWIDELLRVEDQLREIEPRLFQIRFGGAIGAFHSFGHLGAELSSKLAARFNFSISLVPNRTSVDPLLEYISKLSMLGLAMTRISRELFLLTTEELGEVKELQAKGVVGSSTMPQKNNPKHIVRLNVKAEQLRSQAGSAFSMPSPSHEGDSVTNQVLSAAIAQSCHLAVDLLGDALLTLPLMQPDSVRIETNFMANRQALAMESLMMCLAEKIGRTNAHHLVHDLVKQADKENRPVIEVMKANRNIVDNLGSDKIEEVLNLEINTGLSESITLSVVKAAREVATHRDVVISSR